MPQNTSFQIIRPQPSDAGRIAEIHLAAMHSNPLLHAQFPSPASRQALQRFLEAHTAAQLGNSPASGVLVAQDSVAGAIAGFVKWESPRHPALDGKLESGGVGELEGCKREFLERYVRAAEEARERCFGEEKEYYCLSFVCTDPAYQGQGAGSLLTREVLEMAADDGLPVYLESTDVALPMYERLGFRAIDGFEMRIPKSGSDSEELSGAYKEMCMVWYPPRTMGQGQSGGLER
ncbi:hypothetical protein VTI74DRAFT_3145 [Chaetomium olivicolor]